MSAYRARRQRRGNDHTGGASPRRGSEHDQRPRHGGVAGQRRQRRITCTFVLEREIEGAAQDVREKVAGALKNLPPNILPPVIQKSDPDSDADIVDDRRQRQEPSRDDGDCRQTDQARARNCRWRGGRQH